ncbi:MAG: DUF927 domain-containing protein [Zetaproteobacteria bacterium]|nr:DUF927 domain-containing protein [Zetaproteobacteria bacterium]
MENLCRLDLDVSNRDVFQSLAEQFARSPGATALAFAQPGQRNYGEVVVLQAVAAQDLHRLAQEPHNIAFLTDLEGVSQQKSCIEVGRQEGVLQDRYVQRKSLISFDLDFQKGMADFSDLDEANKYRVARVAAYQILSYVEKNRIPLWMLVYSGRGLHLHFKLSTPFKIDSMDTYERNYRRWCELLEIAIGGNYFLRRDCCRPAQLMRLPCSHNLSIAAEDLQTEVMFLCTYAEGAGFFEDMETHLAVWSREPYPRVDPRSFHPAVERREELYRRFDCDAQGVWQILQTEDGCRRRWLCDSLVVEAMSRDGDNEEWGRVLRFCDADGVEKRWTMPMALLGGDGFMLRRILLKKGLHLCLEEDALLPLMQYLLWSRPEQRVRLS